MDFYGCNTNPSTKNIINAHNFERADLQQKIYERSLLLAPVFDRNKEYHAREVMLAEIASTMNPRSDAYQRPIDPKKFASLK